jgi:hypothetical protein
VFLMNKWSKDKIKPEKRPTLGSYTFPQVAE